MEPTPPQADESPQAPSVHNSFHGSSAGTVVQVGTVHGNISVVSTTPEPPTPAQLPPTTRNFVGRKVELERLTEASSIQSDRDAGLIAIGGTAGVGKTALAVFWANSVASEFPDGILFADLRGFSPNSAPRDPFDVINDFLDALGTPTGRVPSTVEARASLYRSALAGKRALVVLDNARDSEQVRPLLPSGRNCVTIVTSRNRLTSLAVREGAYLLSLDALTEAEATELLVSRLGNRHAQEESPAVADLSRLCSQLPLALSIVAARIAIRHDTTLGIAVSELGDAKNRLKAIALSEADLDLRVVFSWSARALTSPTARLFSLLGLHMVSEITANTAAALANAPIDEVRRQLGELADAHLIEQYSTDRYRFHDLLRLYAAERASVDESENDRLSAVRRVLSYYMEVSVKADRILDPHRDPIELPQSDGGPTFDIGDVDDAIAWFRSEKNCLLELVENSVREGHFDAYVWRLAWALVTFFYRCGYWQEYEWTQQAANEAAARLGDRSAEILSLQLLGDACSWQRRYADATIHLEKSLHIARKSGDEAIHARICHTLSWAYAGHGDYERAAVVSNDALKYFRSHRDESGTAHALNALARFKLQLGEHSAALACALEAQSLFAEIDHKPGSASVLETMGLIYREMADHERALASYRNALESYRKLSSSFKVAQILDKIGDINQQQGDLDSARANWDAALEILADARHSDAEVIRRKIDGIAAATPPAKS